MYHKKVLLSVVSDSDINKCTRYELHTIPYTKIGLTSCVVLILFLKIISLFMLGLVYNITKIINIVYVNNMRVGYQGLRDTLNRFTHEVQT